MSTISEVLIQGTKILKEEMDNPSPRLDSEVLLCDLLKLDRSYLLINDNKPLSQEIYDSYLIKILRRKQGEPVAYIINRQEFMGFNFYVDNRVLIPRPDTEILVETTIGELKNHSNKNYKILDIGAGSGAIGLSIAKLFPDIKMTLVDISKDALCVARRNTTLLNICNVEIIQSDCFSNCDDRKFNIIVSNPPYISTEVIKTLQREVREYEPKLALEGGRDGFKYYQRIIEEAKDYLFDDGLLIFEIGFDQAKGVKKLLEENNYHKIEVIKDLAGHDRVVKAQLNIR